MNKEAYEVITGNSYGQISNRQICLDMVDALADEGSIDTRTFNEFIREIAETSDDDLLALSMDFESMFHDIDLPDWLYFNWRDNEFGIWPDFNSAREELDELGAIGDDLPDEPIEGTDYFLAINDHGNITLYKYVESKFHRNKAYWDEIWSVV